MFVFYRDTERVMLCILPESKSLDVSVRMQHTLVEAFCRENDVKVLKVGFRFKLLLLSNPIL